MDIRKAWINGRTLASALRKTRGKKDFGGFAATDRVPIDVARDADVLGIAQQHGVPFVVDGDFLVTVHDFDLASPTIRLNASSDVLTLANLRFTRRALDSAVHDFVADTGSNDTLRIERLAGTLDMRRNDHAFAFSKEVCEWGRGDRVWGKLRSYHTPQGGGSKDFTDALGAAVSTWLQAAARATRPSDAISPGIRIKGLAVSFASKHLRLFDPERFATLDDVISQGLGYALNPAGYNLWLHDLATLKERHALPHRIADIESGIFVLIRQIVRGVDGTDALDTAGAMAEA